MPYILAARTYLDLNKKVIKRLIAALESNTEYGMQLRLCRLVVDLQVEGRAAGKFLNAYYNVLCM